MSVADRTAAGGPAGAERRRELTGAPLLAIQGLRARYAEAEVLHGVDLEVREGEAFFLLGPNGAGKSTLLRCLAGRVRGSGRVSFGGKDLLTLTTRERIRLGVVLCPEGRRLFPEMTVEENLRLGAHLLFDRRGGVSDDIERLTQHLPWLAGRLRQAAGTLSGGEQQMVAVARALMARPRLLLLDEPTVGLSPAAIHALQAWLGLQARDRGVTILGTEQNVVFVRGIATRVAILLGGRIEVQGTPDKLVADVSETAALVARYFGTPLPGDGASSSTPGP